MAKSLRNIKTVLVRPSLAGPYVKYFLYKNVLGLNPVRRLASDIKIGSCVNFSEYHSCSRAVSAGEMKFINRFKFEQGQIIDIGANLGIYSIILAKKNPRNQVIAFEPHPAVFEALSDNLRLNEVLNVRAEKLAVGKSNGSVEFLANTHSRATSRIAGQIIGQVTIPVDVVSLDYYLGTHCIEQISFMKVDVEGFEASVFKGASGALASRKIKAIFFEVCPDAAIVAGFNPADAANILLDFGYSLYRLTEDGGLLPVKVEDANCERVTNWLALAPSVAVGAGSPI